MVTNIIYATIVIVIILPFVYIYFFINVNSLRFWTVQSRMGIMPGTVMPIQQFQQPTVLVTQPSNDYGGQPPYEGQPPPYGGQPQPYGGF